MTSAETSTGTGADGPDVVPLPEARLRRVVVVLSYTEIVSWGILFYAFTVLAPSIRDREGWPLTHLMAVFTMTQVVAAAAGLWVGRHLDVRGPRVVMTAGSALGVLAVVLVALAPTFGAFAAAWVVMGLAMSATLYAPAFTVLTHWAGARRVRALTVVTLVAGLASTVFAPVAALLESQGSWRTAYLLLALPLASTVVVHWRGLDDPWVVAALEHPAAGTTPARAVAVVRSPEFVAVVAAFTLAGFCIYAAVVNLVPLLSAGGLTTVAAAVALGVGGVGQVAGRLLYEPLLARLRVRPRTVLVVAVAALTTVGLAVSVRWVVAACLASFAAGVARGIFTLIQATAVSDRWGTRDFGSRSAVLGGAVMCAAAFSPWLGALLASALDGYVAAFVAIAGGAALAAVVLARLPGPDERSPVVG
jgi:MFS family permease